MLTHKKLVRRIAEYRWRYMMYMAICWGLLILGFYRTGFNSGSVSFWISQSLLFLLGAWLTVLLFSANSRFIGRGGARFTEELMEEGKTLYSEDGVFRFHDKGFSFLADPAAPVFVAWEQISDIHAWVEDNLSADDEICLRIDYGKGHFIEFEEETPGYLKFLQHASSVFPVLAGDWQRELLGAAVRRKRLL